MLAAAPAAGAATREFWVAATPVIWNIAPNVRDNITGARLDPAQTVMSGMIGTYSARRR